MTPTSLLACMRMGHWMWQHISSMTTLPGVLQYESGLPVVQTWTFQYHCHWPTHHPQHSSPSISWLPSPTWRCCRPSHWMCHASWPLDLEVLQYLSGSSAEELQCLKIIQSICNELLSMCNAVVCGVCQTQMDKRWDWEGGTSGIRCHG